MGAAECRAAKIIATLGPATWTPEGMSRLLAADIDVVRFNVKHQTPEENQALLDMWRGVAQANWEAAQQKLGLQGLVQSSTSPVGIMVSIWYQRLQPRSDLQVAVSSVAGAAGAGTASTSLVGIMVSIKQIRQHHY